MSFGIPVEYLMMRGIFMAPGATADQVAYYIQVLDKVRALPEWRDFMAQGAFKPSAMNGEPFVAWLDKAESFHRIVMREARLTYAYAAVAETAAPAPTPAKDSAPTRKK